MTDGSMPRGVSGAESGSGHPADVGRSSTPDATPASAGYNLRRAATIDEGAFLRRRRPTLGGARDSVSDDWSPSARRRSSNLSQDARNILDPGLDEGPSQESHASSRWETLPLVFALFPAIAGVFFQGGSAVATDLILLTFGGLFLHWAVTQPWSWYISAQQVRAAEEHSGDIALVDSDSEEDETAHQQQDEGSETGDPLSRRERSTRARQRQARDAALKQLYLHETWALISCFMSPLVGAYILHQIRNQLTRPAEGLVSNYNLTIFIVVSEVRPLQQVIKLVRSRTLHIQRIVHANPYRHPSSPTTASSPSSPQLEDLIRRIEELEARPSDPTASSEQNGHESQALKRADARRERDAIERDVRAQIQPELDTLARVLRRSRRDLVQMGAHIDEAHRHMSQRLDDAYSLASIAVARNESLFRWLFGWIPWLLNSVASLVLVFLMLPLHQARRLFGGGGQDIANSGKNRKMRYGKTAVGLKRKI